MRSRSASARRRRDRRHLGQPPRVRVLFHLRRAQRHSAFEKRRILLKRHAQQFHRVIKILLLDAVIPLFPELTHLPAYRCMIPFRHRL